LRRLAKSRLLEIVSAFMYFEASKKTDWNFLDNRLDKTTMSLKQQINEDLKAAMKSKDPNRINTVRSIRAALLEKEVSIRVGGEGELNAEQEMQVLMSLAKRRKDSIEQFKSAGRDDLVEKEAAELAILETYLPKPLSEDEIRETVEKIIAQVGATSAKDFGKVMGAAMKALKGKADGNVIQKIAKEKLG